VLSQQRTLRERRWPIILPRHFRKGQSGNPGGRSKAHAKLAKKLREMTNECNELAEFACRVLRGEEEGMTAPACRQWACEFIAERTLGKPQYEIGLPPEAPKTSWEFSKLTLEELEIFEPLLDKVRRRGQNASELVPDNGSRQLSNVGLKPRDSLGLRLGQRGAMVGAPHRGAIIVEAARVAPPHGHASMVAACAVRPCVGHAALRSGRSPCRSYPARSRHRAARPRGVLLGERARRLVGRPGLIGGHSTATAVAAAREGTAEQ